MAGRPPEPVGAPYRAAAALGSERTGHGRPRGLALGRRRRHSATNAEARRMEARMTQDEFAEALRRLVGYGGDEGLDRETLLAVIEEQAAAMRECDD